LELCDGEWDNKIKVQIKKCGGDWFYVGQAKSLVVDRCEYNVESSGSMTIQKFLDNMRDS
jgi:hypothetical protein